MHKFERLEVWQLAIEYEEIEEYVFESATPFDDPDNEQKYDH
jgi:hypothetical protein